MVPLKKRSDKLIHLRDLTRKEVMQGGGARKGTGSAWGERNSFITDKGVGGPRGPYGGPRKRGKKKEELVCQSTKRRKTLFLCGGGEGSWAVGRKRDRMGLVEKPRVFLLGGERKKRVDSATVFRAEKKKKKPEFESFTGEVNSWERHSKNRPPITSLLLPGKEHKKGITLRGEAQNRERRKQKVVRKRKE